MDCATSSSSAPMTGAAAAMADPPQMEDPTPMRVAVLSGILNARRRIAASNSAVQMVPTMIGRDCFPCLQDDGQVETESQQNDCALDALFRNEGDTAFKRILLF